MNISAEIIKSLLFLIPGFISLKTVAYVCDIRREDYPYYIIESLIHALFIYGILSLLSIVDLNKPVTGHIIFLITSISFLFGTFWGLIKKYDIFSKIFSKLIFSKGILISSRDKIFHSARHKGFFNQWVVVGLKNGGEIIGFIREYDTDNNEIFMEKAQFVLKDGRFSEKSSLYFPSNNEISFIREVTNDRKESNSK